MIGKRVIVRTYSAGVHYGTLASRDGKEVVLHDSRRIWYWDGAASLSQLAAEGTNKPQDCKFSVPVAEILLTEAIEIIPTTDKACASIAGVEQWKAFSYGSGSGDGCVYGEGDGYGDGYCSGSGYGSGYGDGSGDDDGSGEGDGSGSGYGSGYGSGSGDDDGSGSGYGSGSGEGDGSGYGSGSGSGSGDDDGSGEGDGSGYGYGYGSG